jgi:hypothetical protein
MKPGAFLMVAAVVIGVLALIAPLYVNDRVRRAEIAGLKQTQISLERRLAEAAADLVTLKRLATHASLPPASGTGRSSLPTTSAARSAEPGSRATVPHAAAPSSGTIAPGAGSASASPPAADAATAPRKRVRILLDGQELNIDGKVVDESDMREFPPNRIERIEVLPTEPGAEPSTGTVNVILRKDLPVEPSH